MGIPERLQALVRDNFQSLKDFAQACGLPYRTAQEYVGGKRKPGAESLEKLGTRLHVSLNWLVLGEGPIFLSSPGSAPGEAQEASRMDPKLLAAILRDFELYELSQTGQRRPAPLQSELTLLSEDTVADRMSVARAILDAKLLRAGERGVLAAYVYNEVAHIADEGKRRRAARDKVAEYVSLKALLERTSE